MAKVYTVRVVNAAGRVWTMIPAYVDKAYAEAVAAVHRRIGKDVWVEPVRGLTDADVMACTKLPTGVPGLPYVALPIPVPGAPAEPMSLDEYKRQVMKIHRDCAAAVALLNP